MIANAGPGWRRYARGASRSGTPWASATAIATSATFVIDIGGAAGEGEDGQLAASPGPIAPPFQPSRNAGSADANAESA